MSTTRILFWSKRVKVHDPLTQMIFQMQTEQGLSTNLGEAEQNQSEGQK